MATSALKVSEKAARRIFKDMKYDSWKTMSTKKLEKGLANIREDLNGETSIEELDISNPAKSTLEEIVDAIDDERGFVIVPESDEGEEEEAVETKKRGRKPAVKTEKATKVRTKTPKKSEAKAAKTQKKSSGSKYDPEKAAVYQEKLKKEGQRIEKAILSGPKTVEAIAAKANVSESRVQSFMNYYNRNRKEPMYKVVKGGKVVKTSKD